MTDHARVLERNLSKRGSTRMTNTMINRVRDIGRCKNTIVRVIPTDAVLNSTISGTAF